MVPPLKKLTKKGDQYQRLPTVQQFLEELDKLENDQRIDRLIDGAGVKHSDIPPEALVHHVRQAWLNKNLIELERLVKAFMHLLHDILHRTVPNIADAEGIRDQIVSDFLKRFAEDCRDEKTWADIYEVVFWKAFTTYQKSALRRLNPKSIKKIPLMGDGAHSPSTELTREVQKAADEFFGNIPSALDNLTFRSALYDAINTLPIDQKRVIALLLEGIPIDSKDPNTTTIAGVLKCSERTARNRRDRAYEALKTILEKEKANATK
jgi:DNA-directed RNA polymerase specialized sigma24 family protein